MIQRIQSVYLAILMLLLAAVALGTELFSYVNESVRFTFSSYGITTYGPEGNITNQQHMPVYVGLIALILLAFICLMSYKNLARQFRLGRMVFYLYSLMVVSLLLMALFGDSMVDSTEPLKRQLGLGFYLFMAGYPFSFLANTGIKRDKRLLDSLDRIR